MSKKSRCGVPRWILGEFQWNVMWISREFHVNLRDANGHRAWRILANIVSIWGQLLQALLSKYGLYWKKDSLIMLTSHLHRAYGRVAFSLQLPLPGKGAVKLIVSWPLGRVPWIFPTKRLPSLNGLQRHMVAGNLRDCCETANPPKSSRNRKNLGHCRIPFIPKNPSLIEFVTVGPSTGVLVVV